MGPDSNLRNGASGFEALQPAWCGRRLLAGL